MTDSHIRSFMTTVYQMLCMRQLDISPQGRQTRDHSGEKLKWRIRCAYLVQNMFMYLAGAGRWTLGKVQGLHYVLDVSAQSPRLGCGRAFCGRGLP